LYFVVNKLIACLQQVLAQFSLYINEPKYKIGHSESQFLKMLGISVQLWVC